MKVAPDLRITPGHVTNQKQIFEKNNITDLLPSHNTWSSYQQKAENKTDL